MIQRWNRLRRRTRRILYHGSYILVVLVFGAVLCFGCSSKPYQPWTGKVVGERTENANQGLLSPPTTYYLIVRADSDGQLYPVNVDVELSVCAPGTKVTVFAHSLAGC